ncbi:pyridoxal phosphate-dependent aminotransferase [Labrys sp. KB_33_2]|uniref:pyridoxal phosphate-dependent aminotransferase n=1 Tax=unclassified Labrys (in: a-proteobacteria) TaxID=2688601 RepID=UPI003EBE04E2
MTAAFETIPSAPTFLDGIRPEALGAPESGIVEVMNYGRTRQGMIPLWAGEGDVPTPAFITEAATRSLAAGETFYTWQRGIPDLREALARYHTNLFGKPFSADRFFVTQSGMHAIQTAVRLIAGAGDEVIVPTPAWPNFAAAIGVAGAKPVMVPQIFTEQGWKLDFQRLADAITPRTRGIFINSPSNPTGWVATAEDIAFVLDLARRHGLWIFADEIYTRFHYAGGRAPSFRDIRTPEDRIIFTDTFSKNWAMTGWRIGWMEAPPELGQTIENLLQYSTSGVATFLQRAGIAALERGESFVEHQIARARQGRDIVINGLSATGKVRFAPASGAFYLFFSVEGKPDVRRLGLEIVDQANVGLAPGTAFGAGGEGFMRLCYLRSPEQLQAATQRLVDWLDKI